MRSSDGRVAGSLPRQRRTCTREMHTGAASILQSEPSTSCERRPHGIPPGASVRTARRSYGASMFRMRSSMRCTSSRTVLRTRPIAGHAGHPPATTMRCATHERHLLLANGCECLCEAPFSYGLAIADSALHMRGTTNEELLDRLSIADDRTGIARRASSLPARTGARKTAGNPACALPDRAGLPNTGASSRVPQPHRSRASLSCRFFLGADRAAWHHRRVRRHGKVPGSSAAQRSNHDRGAGRRASARIPTDLAGASGPTVHLSGPSPSHPAKSGARKRWHTPGPRGGASLARCLGSGKASLNTAPDRGGPSRRTFSRRVCRCASVRAFARASRRAVRRVHFARKDCNILQDRALKTGPFLANRCNLFLHFVRRISPSENGCAAHRAHLAR